jgi:ABC-type sugar transport system substrate-binding protein
MAAWPTDEQAIRMDLRRRRRQVSLEAAKRFCGMAASIVLALLALGQAPARALSVGVALMSPHASTRALQDGIAEQARSRDIAVQFVYAPEGAEDQQIAQVQQLIAAQVDALLVMPVATAARVAITRLAQEADIPLVLVGSGLGDDWPAGRVALVQPNDLVAGRLQMRKLAQMLNGTGRIAIIAGDAADPRSTQHLRGVREVMAEYPGLQRVAEGAADGNGATARALVAAWLSKDVGIDAIAAGNDAMALGAAEALEHAGLPAGRVLIGGVGATPEGIAAMQRQRLAVTIYQDAALQGRRAIDDALALIRREPVPHSDWVPFELVTDRMSTTHFAR